MKARGHCRKLHVVQFTADFRRRSAHPPQHMIWDPSTFLQARHQAHGQLEQKIAEIDAGGIIGIRPLKFSFAYFWNHDTFLQQVYYYVQTLNSRNLYQILWVKDACYLYIGEMLPRTSKDYQWRYHDLQFIIVKTSDATDAYVWYTPLARGRGVEELPIGVGDSRQLGEFLSSNKSNISLYCSTLGCGGACGCALRHADVSQGMTRHSVLHKAQFACCFIERELIYLTWSLIVYWLTKWTIGYYGGWKKSCTSW